jgi:hypothetical protein
MKIKGVNEQERRGGKGDNIMKYTKYCVMVSREYNRGGELVHNMLYEIITVNSSCTTNVC